MHRVGAVGFEGRAVVELHHAAEFVSLGARGDVFADPGFGQAGDPALEVADCGDDLLLLFGGDAGPPAKGEGVDDHGAILRDSRFGKATTPLPLRFRYSQIVKELDNMSVRT